MPAVSRLTTGCKELRWILRLDACLKTPLWHLPGPNPIISPWKPGGKPAWMSYECEVAGGVDKMNATHWFFVYHCLSDKAACRRRGRGDPGAAISRFNTSGAMKMRGAGRQKKRTGWHVQGEV